MWPGLEDGKYFSLLAGTQTSSTNVDAQCSAITQNLVAPPRHIFWKDRVHPLVSPSSNLFSNPLMWGFILFFVHIEGVCTDNRVKVCITKYCLRVVVESLHLCLDGNLFFILSLTLSFSHCRGPAIVRPCYKLL